MVVWRGASTEIGSDSNFAASLRMSTSFQHQQPAPATSNQQPAPATSTTNQRHQLSRSRMILLMYLPQILPIDVSINLRRRNVSVAKHFLNRTQIGAALE